MYIYADIVIGINLIFNMIILYLTCWAAGITVSYSRIIFASFIGSIYALCEFVPELSILYTIPLKIIISLLIVFLGIGFRSVRLFFLQVGLFYLISFLIGGAAMGWIYFSRSDYYLGSAGLITGRFNFQNILLGGIIGAVLTLVLIRGITSRQFRQKLKFKVVVYLGNCSVDFNAILDTGNRLFSFTKVPVIIAESKIIKPLFSNELGDKFDMLNIEDAISVIDEMPDAVKKKIEIVPSRSVGGNKLLLGFRPDKVLIYDNTSEIETTDVIIALTSARISTDGEYSALLNPAIMHNHVAVKREASVCA